MMERLSISLFNPVQAHQTLLNQVWPHIKSMLMAGHELVIEIKQISKTRDQEKKYHAMIGEVTKQASHLGATWGNEDWKRLLLDKFARDTGRSHGRVIPNLDKTGVVEVGLQSRKFSRKDGAEFIEWLHVWGAENGIEFIDQETGELV
ncbi:MAG: recombination protein NinB [Burkholderiaceae bacterium]